jgi:hypothetical protein
MLEKLVQAAIITFLLHLIAGLNSANTLDSKAVPQTGTISMPVVSYHIRPLE